MPYVDGFVVPLPKKNLQAYRRMSNKAGKVWRELGALEYRECVADGRDANFATFRRQVRLKRGETVVFSWIVYRSRAHRDRVNAQVMKDPRMSPEQMKDAMPFDMKRMAYGGFKVVVDV
jgi:uncharacterized protein YbaA (DUF1428 family)